MGYFSWYGEDKSKHLSHHGVKGQRWGVRRFQDKSGRRTAAGKKQDRYNRTVRNAKSKGGAKTEGIEKYNVGLTTFTRPDGSKYTSGLTDGHDWDWKETFNGETPANPDLLSAGDQWMKDNAPNRNISQFVIDRINPGYGKYNGTTQNCAKCSATLELVLHGYTASAGRQSFPSTSDAEEFWWKGAKAVEYDNDSCESSLKSYGPGTSGTISIKYPGSNNGHAMHWTNDTNGNFTIEDGQNGKIFSSLKQMTDLYGADTSAGYTTYRLDNCEPDWDHMAQDSVVRISSEKDQVYLGGQYGLRRTNNPDAAMLENKWSGKKVGYY